MADNAESYMHLLSLNSTYAEFIARSIRKVEEMIRKNKLNQRCIQDALRRLDFSAYSASDGKATKITQSTCYSNPYFRGDGQICPPLSQETGEILATTDVNCLMRPERPWRGADLKKLREHVKCSILENYLVPLSSRAELLAEKISSSGVDTPAELKAKWRVDLRKLHAKINYSLSIGSESILLEQCRLGADEMVDWQRISTTALNGERTVQQLRARWLNEASPLWSARPWSRGEDKLLVELVDAREHVGNDWESISRMLANVFSRHRSPYQCFQRWIDVCQCDRGTKKYWTSEEDEILIRCVKAYKKIELVNWAQISRALPGRSKFMCELRYRRTLCETLRRGAWSREEDECLLEAVQKYGTSDWHLIAKFVPGRTNLQCRNRYQNNLRADLKEGMFSLEEDERLLFGVKTFGRHQLAIVARLLPDRGMDSIKARFRSFIKARIAGCNAWLNQRTKTINYRVPDPVYDFTQFLETRRLQADGSEEEEGSPIMLQRRVKCEPLTADVVDREESQGNLPTKTEMFEEAPPTLNPRSDGRWCMTLKGGWINVGRPAADPLQKVADSKRKELSQFINSLHSHYGSAEKDAADRKRYERLSTLLNTSFNLRPSDFNFVGVRLQLLLNSEELVKANWPHQARRRRLYKNNNDKKPARKTRQKQIKKKPEIDSEDEQSDRENHKAPASERNTQNSTTTRRKGEPPGRPTKEDSGATMSRKRNESTRLSSVDEVAMKKLKTELVRMKRPKQEETSDDGGDTLNEGAMVKGKLKQDQACTRQMPTRGARTAARMKIKEQQQSN